MVGMNSLMLFQVERTAVGTAVILLSFSSFNSLVVPQDSMKLKQKIKQHVDVLLQVKISTYDIQMWAPDAGLIGVDFFLGGGVR